MMSDPSMSDTSSNPQIEQQIRGDRNQVIGQAIDSTIVNFAGEGQVIHLTLHDRVPKQSAPPPIHEIKPLTQREYRQRQILLSKVRDYWVKGVLEKSLHARVLVELGLQKRLDLVHQPFSGVDEFTEVSGQVLAQGTNATEVFDHMAVGRTLLILGEPGSGKTITLLKLAQDLLTRTEADLQQPIPVVLNLSSWARKTQTIAQWLVQELLEKYQVSKALGKIWVETEALILLLDGLDEVKAEQRNACVQALNQFMQTHGTTELVVCCRIQDYQALADRLMLRSAICIQPLTSDQIDQYFVQAKEQLSSLKEVLHQDEELQGLATSPLMLSIMSLAYQGSNQKDIIQGGTPENYRQRLFNTYIDRMFQWRGTTQQYSRQKTQHWLIWLAQRMTAASQTIFLIERLQPSWLQTRQQRIRYRIESGLIGWLMTGLMAGLVAGLLGGLYGGVYSGLLYGGLASSSWYESIQSVVVGLCLGLMYGSVYGLLGGLIIGLIYGLISGFFNTIQPVEMLKWSWQEAKKGFLTGMLLGLVLGLLLGLVIGLFPKVFPGLASEPSFQFASEGLSKFAVCLIAGVTAGLILGSIFGLIGGFISAFRGSSIQSMEKPNQGIHQSARNALILAITLGSTVEVISGLIGGLTADIISGLIGGLTFALIVGLTGGLIGGGSACIRHFALRLMLYRLGYAPWNYTRFLKYATDRLFLQKVGGGYIFVHRMLMEHFAAMPLEEGKR
jgi:hypothetical protein